MLGLNKNRPEVIMDYFDYDFNDEDYDSEEVFLGTQEIESFNSFAHRHNTYLEKLYTNMQVTYETFLLVFNKQYKKILEFPNCYDLACRLGYGMLMRHILETVSAYLVYESDILLSDDATVFDRLTSLFEKNAPGYDINTHRVLMHTLDLTNEIAHPHIISDSPTSLDEIKEFYFT